MDSTFLQRWWNAPGRVLKSPNFSAVYDMLGSERGYIVVFDLEMTAWKGSLAGNWGRPGEHREIVQFGAVKLDADHHLIEVAAYQSLVVPRINPKLSSYFVQLTGISQTRLESHGISFVSALAEFHAFVGPAVSCIYSNGTDMEVIQENCEINHIDFPFTDSRWVDLRPQLSKRLGKSIDVVDSSALPGLLDVEMDSTAHNALSDARSIAVALRTLRWRDSQCVGSGPDGIKNRL